MCNPNVALLVFVRYMMVYSEIPHFSSCLGDRNSEALMGPGGFPLNGKLVSESSVGGMWKPPSMQNEEGHGIEGVRSS